MWGNYLDRTATGIATATVSIGPIYVFRNVENTCRTLNDVPTDQDDRGGFGKLGDDPSNPRLGGGRRYFFHNTTLQAPPPAGSVYPLGAGQGIYDAGGPMTNTVSRNNIWDIWKPWWQSIGDNQVPPSLTNDFDDDLYDGVIAAYAGAEPDGIHAAPVYAPGNGWVSGSGGMYALDPTSPGYHTAVPIPNFNDSTTTPDMGAHQSGTPPMQFGVDAYP